MRLKRIHIRLFCWLTFLSLAFFSNYSVPNQDYVYPKSTSVDLIFSNGRGPLTAQQEKSIQTAVNKIKNNSGHSGIRLISAPNQNFISRHFQKADDQSVVTYQAQLQQPSNLRAIRQLLQLTGIDTQVIVPFIHQIATKSQINQIRVCMIIGTGIIIGMFFRSILAPLLVAFLSLVAERCGWLCTNLWASFFHFQTTTLTALLILIFSTVVLPICSIIILREFSNHIEIDSSATSLFKRAQVSGLWALLTIVPGIWFVWSRASVLQNLSICLPLSILTWIILFTLLPSILATLRENTFWPGPAWIFNDEHHLWYYLSKVAHRFPKISFGTLIVALLLLGYGFQSLKFAQSNSDVDSVQHHLIRNPRRTLKLAISSPSVKLNSHYFSDIDQLTNQLRADQSVKSVASITQPLAKPWNKFNVNQHLKTTTNELEITSTMLKAIYKEVQATSSALNASDLKQFKSKFQITNDDAQTNMDNIEQVFKQATALTDTLKALNSDYFNQTELKIPLNEIKALISKFETNARNILTLKENATIIASKQAFIQKDVDELIHNTQNLSESLNQIAPKITSAIRNCEQSARSLNEISQSQLLNNIFIGKEALKNPLFKTALNFYSGSKAHQTVLVIETKSTVNQELYVQELLKQLPQLTSNTNLKNSQYQLSGTGFQPANFLIPDAFKWGLLAVTTLVIVGMLFDKIVFLKISLSIITSIISTLVANYFIIRFRGNLQDFDMYFFVNVLITLLLIVFSNQVLNFSTITKNSVINLDAADQIINLMLMVIFVLCGSLVLVHSALLTTIAMIIGLTFLVELVLFPLIVVSTIRLLFTNSI